MSEDTLWQKVQRWADRSVRPAAFVVLLLAIVADVDLIFWGTDADKHEYLAPLTIFLSALMATYGWMWSGHVNRRLARKNQSLALLLALRQPHVHEWKKVVYEYIARNNPADPLPDEVDRLLGFYEFISIAVMNGTADEDIIKESQRYVYWKLANGLKAYIDKCQDDESSIYCHFVHYTQEWNSERKRPSFVSTDHGDFIGRRARKGAR